MTRTRAGGGIKVISEPTANTEVTIDSPRVADKGYGSNAPATLQVYTSSRTEAERTTDNQTRRERQPSKLKHPTTLPLLFSLASTKPKRKSTHPPATTPSTNTTPPHNPRPPSIIMCSKRVSPYVECPYGHKLVTNEKFCFKNGVIVPCVYWEWLIINELPTTGSCPCADCQALKRRQAMQRGIAASSSNDISQ